MKENVIAEKSFRFAIEIVKFSQDVMDKYHEYVLSRQLLKSGTSIGALVRESAHAESKADFLHKMTVALKEANETEYWILLFGEKEIKEQEVLQKLRSDCDELIRLLASIVKTTKASLRK